VTAEAPRWEHFAHEADVGVHGIGHTPDEAFEQAAVALTAAITDPAGVAATEPVAIECEAPDVEMLLVDWLNALVYEMAVRRMLFSRFEVEIAGTHLSARAWGERVDPARHQPAVEIKGATCTALAVGLDIEGLWHARCVVDV
jgi:SHS2 domain-containing protein